MTGKPLKKRPIKKTASDPHSTKRLPSGPGKCQHAGYCFRVQITGDNLDIAQTNYHWPNEGSAVMFASRTSRDQFVHATVYGPDQQVICSFSPRTYDVAKARHALLDDNEARAVHTDVWTQVDQARKDGVAQPAIRKKVLRK